MTVSPRLEIINGLANTNHSSDKLIDGRSSPREDKIAAAAGYSFSQITFYLTSGAAHKCEKKLKKYLYS
jgi:hypothetical protein